MRQIVKDSLRAFFAGETFKRSNMQVTIHEWGGGGKGYQIVKLYQHGNCIAFRPYGKSGGSVSISNCGWFSVTTKDRLNEVVQRATNGLWWLGSDGEGRWCFIGARHHEQPRWNGSTFDIQTLLDLDATILNEQATRARRAA